MTFIDTHALGEGLNRMAKMALDSGEASSVEEALALFHSYSLHLEVSPDVATNVSQQAALLTAANAARRAFLGGVTVNGAAGIACLLPGWNHADLTTVLREIGVHAGPRPEGAPIIHIGAGPADGEALLRTVTHGWCGGCVPAGAEMANDPGAFVLSGIVAGAMAVCEIFQKVRRSNPAAGRRSVGLSLWDPGADWTAPDASAAPPPMLPSAAWLVGLGNLGQAFLWAIGMLDYADPGAVTLTLQDFDRIAVSNDSTSLLTSLDLVGEPKTRAVARWAETRGFRTRLIERRFAADFRLSANDPAVALCGVDNGLARAALEDVGFACILEAGLGAGVSDYLAIRLHSFPQQRKAREIWAANNAAASALLAQPAYRQLAASGADRCGLVQLAGRTVGAPFVGAIAGALTIAELVRLANGGSVTAVADLHLRSLDHSTVVRQPAGFGHNPGFTPSR